MAELTPERVAGIRERARGLGHTTTGDVVALCNALDAARALLREIAVCGVTLEDPRLRYMEVQIGVELMRQIRALFPPPANPTGGETEGSNQ